MREPNAVDKFIQVNPTTNLIEPNWMYREILPFSLGPDAAKFSAGVIALPDNNPVVVPYKLPHSSLGFDDAVGSPLAINEIVQTGSGSTNPQYTVFVTDMGDVRQYMNYPIHVETFAGSGQLSARLTEDLFVPTRHQLMVTFQKIGGGDSINAQLYLLGKYFDTWASNLQKYNSAHKDIIDTVNKALERRKYVTPYWLTTENGVVTVPANQTVTVDTLVGDEGHFESTHILRKFTGGDPTAAPFQLELINPQTRQSLMNGKIHSYMIGNAYNPQPFPAPFMIPAGQILRFRITDLSGSTNAVYLTLRGMRIRAPFDTRADVEKKMGLKPTPHHKGAAAAPKAATPAVPAKPVAKAVGH